MMIRMVLSLWCGMRFPCAARLTFEPESVAQAHVYDRNIDEGLNMKFFIAGLLGALIGAGGMVYCRVLHEGAMKALPVRENLSSGTKWEPIFGFSRAVKVGNTIHVSGTTAWDEAGAIVGVGDAYLQTRQILNNIQPVLERGGASMKDVVRTRIFVTSFDSFAGVAKAHAEFFGDIRPATTMVAVGKMLDDDAMVEIDVEAVVSR